MYDAKLDFSEDYQESRAKFIAALDGKGELHSVKHPEQGPDGNDLYIDFGVIGPADAEGALVLVSGTHGPEIFAGSGPQTALLNSGLIIDYDDLKIILIHAHNPYGCAWLRRTDHNNIDLNRNYYDPSKPFTPNPGYDVLRPVIVPETWDAATVGAGMKAYEDEHGKMGLLAALVVGQRHDPDGMFYGGTEPAWSQLQMRDMLAKLTANQKTVSMIDFHTGLGPYGVPYMVHGYEIGTPEFVSFKAAYEGEVRSTMDPADMDEDLPGSPEGPIVLGVAAMLPEKQTYAVVIEFGTVPTEVVFPTLLKDNWMHLNETPGTDAWNAHKQQVREAFYPLEPEWKDMIWERAVWAIERSANLARGKFS